MVMDNNYAYDNHFEVYTNNKLCYKPETNVIC